MNQIKLLDCTLRDGAYINNAEFGESTLAGLIKSLKTAHVDIIECGWLKNEPYIQGSSYFHLPTDMSRFLKKDSNDHTMYVAMIDYDRYDISKLPQNA